MLAPQRGSRFSILKFFLEIVFDLSAFSALFLVFLLFLWELLFFFDIEIAFDVQCTSFQFKLEIGIPTIENSLIKIFVNLSGKDYSTFTQRTDDPRSLVSLSFGVGA